MKKLVCLGALVLGIGLAGGVQADEITDAAIKKAARFLKVKAEVKEWKRSQSSLVDAWERLGGLSKLVWLRHDGSLPAKWLPQLHRRISAVQKLQVMWEQEDALMLRAIIRLYTDYAQRYLSGHITYDNYLPVKDFALSYGQRFAESVRGKPYDSYICKWGDLDCKPPKDAWEQKL